MDGVIYMYIYIICIYIPVDSIYIYMNRVLYSFGSSLVVVFGCVPFGVFCFGWCTSAHTHNDASHQPNITVDVCGKYRRHRVPVCDVGNGPRALLHKHCCRTSSTTRGKQEE